MQDVAYLASLCTTGRRLPTRAKKMSELFLTLDERIQLEVQQLMIKKDVQLGMALRACQAAPSNIIGAERIIDALIVVFGRTGAISILQQADYYRRLFACAERLAQPKKNRLRLALRLLEHLEALFGSNEELQTLLETIQDRLGNRPSWPQTAAVCV